MELLKASVAIIQPRLRVWILPMVSNVESSNMAASPDFNSAAPPVAIATSAPDDPILRHCACVDTTPHQTVPALREKMFAHVCRSHSLCLLDLPTDYSQIQSRFNRVVEVDQRDPHSIHVAPPHQVSAQLVCNRFRRQIVVQPEVALIERFAAQFLQRRI